MATPIYATADDFGEWLGDFAVDVSDQTLAAASEVIDEVLVGVVYDVDTVTELPRDSRVGSALRDATCAQAQWMQSTGDLSGAGDQVEWDSAKIGTVSYSGARRAAAAGRTMSGAEVAPRAWRILRLAGLTASTVLTYG